MKIVCDACGTRYSIEDSRVAGRSFKVRCKQCAHVILLPGTRAPTAEPAAAGTWHAVIDGMPRPIGVEDLRQLHTAGVIEDRTLVWREGFDDWRELGSVDELRRARPGSVEIAPEAATDGTAVDLPKASSDAAADAASERPAPAPLRGVRHENSVLFSLGNLARLAAPAPAAASPTGRNEGSGLLDIQSLARSLLPARGERGAAEVGALPVYGALPFSEPAVLIPKPPPRRDRRLIWALAATAGALAAVTVILAVIVLHGGTAAHAGTPPALPAVPGASPPTPTSPGAVPAATASSEAVAYTQPTADPARTSAEATAPSADRTERVASAPSADRTERTAAAPSASRTDPAAAASADRTERTATAPSAIRTDHAAAAASADRIERTATAPSASRTDHAATAASADRTERVATSPGQTGHTAGSAAHGGSTAAHGAGTATASHGSPADAASRRASSRTASLAPADSAEACSEVTCIVNGYADPCCAIHRRPAAAAPAPAGGELPERLDRPAIAGGLARIDTSGCGKQSSAHGEVKVSVQVSPAGAVSDVTVKRSPDPALEACVAAAVRKGAFPATQRGGSFGYAWRF